MYKKFLLFSIFIISSLFVFNSCEDKAGKPNNVTYPTINGQPIREGVTRLSDDSLAFVLFAPGKASVHLVGDLNRWQISDEYELHKDKDTDRFWIKIGNLDKSKEYVFQYLIDRKIYVADPYANRVIDRNNNNSEPAMVVSTKINDYNWKISHFSVNNPENLTIYELLIRDFTSDRTIQAVQEKLPYLKALGINAIELMPFNEFEGNDSWGYNPSFYFAPEKAYGVANDYKSFIDECHANGIAVIMDMVLNHSYGQSPMVRMYQNADGTIAADNPWYNVKSPNSTYSWGYDFNHESPYTQAFVDSVCSYWIKEYKIDGYRFDFTKGFTNKPGDGWAYDESRIKILKRMADEIWKRKRDALVILEHLTDNSEEKVLDNYGMLLWGNINGNTNEATMGWNESNKSDLSGASYKQRTWEKPALVAYMESHDEERLMFKNLKYGNSNGSYNVKDLPTALQRNAAAAVVFFSIPGPKMIWQFGELGYDVSIDENGRVGKKPIRWEYYDQPDRRALYDVYSKIINLRTTRPVFSTTDFSISLVPNFKYVVLKSTQETVVAMANFDVKEVSKDVNFEKTGNWQEYFTNSTLTTTANTENITLQPGEFRLYFSK